MTHLRKVMLEELQRRNFSSETIRVIGAVERSRATSANRPISWARITSDSIRLTCYTSESWQSERWWLR